MQFSAAIFDLDGTVIDSEWVWGEAIRRILKQLGVKEKRKYPQIGGIGVPANWKILVESYRLGDALDIRGLTERTFEEFIKLIPQIKAMPGFFELAEKLKEKGIKLGLATSTESRIVEKVFENLPIENLFDSVTTGDEVKNRKPAPDLFLKAAEKLGVHPEHGLVFEDAPSGVEAARRAGMKVVALARDAEYAKQLNGADLVVKNFEEFLLKEKSF